MSGNLESNSTWTKLFLYICQNVLSDYFMHILIIFIAPYQSVKAIQRNDTKVVMKWLSFWIILHLFSFAEFHSMDSLAFMIPYYYPLKLILLLALMFGGLSVGLYHIVLDPLVRRIGTYLNDTNKGHYVKPDPTDKTDSSTKKQD